MVSTATAQRARPTPAADGSSAFNDRSSPYGDRMVGDILGSRPDLADEGSFYSASNATPDTAVGCGVIAAYASTTPLFLVSNTAAPGTGRTIKLDSLRMFRFTVAPASGTCTLFSVEVDTTPRLVAAPSGGVQATVVNVNPSKANDFEGQVWGFSGGTVLTVAAAANKRIVTRGMISHSIPVVLDEQVLTFGQPANGTALAAGVGRRIAHAGPVVIPPGCSAAIHVYYPSNAITGASFEWELLMSQR